MKLHTSTATIERSGVQAENQFTIKTTAQAFDILSSGLYTDPIAAVIRELSCNAKDAHIAANKADVPFTIHLPNNLEPYLAIIDDGIGLSDEQIRGELVPVTYMEQGVELPVTDDNGEIVYQRVGGLYTTYFESTKTNSDDFIGALGLGSKSPFSYTQAFDVISRFDGTKYIYSIFLNEDGIPSVALLGQNETTECNGVEVRISVEAKDFHKFSTTTANALQFFDPKPIVVGELNFKFTEKPASAISGDDWMLVEHKWNKNAFTAVQGDVPYRVDIYQLDDYLDEYGQMFVRNVNIVTFFDIGEIDFAANREEIRYDKQTCETLAVRLTKIRQELTVQLERELEQYQDGFWSASIKIRKLTHEIFGTTQFSTFIDRKDVTLPILKQFIANQGNVTLSTSLGHEIVTYEDISRGRTNRTKRKNIDAATITPSADTVIFYNDCKQSGIGRVKSFLYDSRYRRVIMISPLKNPIERKGQDGVALTFDGYDKELERLTNDLGNPEILNVADHTDPIEKQTNNSTFYYQFYECRRVRRSYWRENSVISWNSFTSETLDKKSTTKLYFFLEHRSHITTHNDMRVGWKPDETQDGFEAVLNIINNHFGTQYTIYDTYGVSKRTIRTVENKPDWKNLFSLYEEALQSIKTKIESKMRYNATVSNDDFNILDRIKIDSFQKQVRNLSPDSKFRLAVEPLINDATLYDFKGKDIDVAYLYLQRHRQDMIPDANTPYFQRDDFKEYKLLPLLDHYAFADNEQEVFEYINLIDRN